MTSPPAIVIDEDDRPPSPFLTSALQPALPWSAANSSNANGLVLPKARSAAGQSTESFHLPSGSETKRINEVYRALEKGGVRGDGYETGLELTRERRGPSWMGRFEDVQARANDSSDQFREDEVLAKTDSPSAQQASGHHRSAHLPASAYSSLPSTSSSKASTSAVPLNDDFRAAPKLSARAREKERERTDKWAEMLEVAERDKGGNALRWKYCAECVRSSSRVSSKTQRRVYKGIPDRWRPAAWTAMLDLNANATRSPASLYSASSPRASSSLPPSPTRSVASSRSRFSLRRRRKPSAQSLRDAPPLPTSQDSQLSNAQLQINARIGESWQDANRRFEEAEGMQSEQDVQIDLDVPRTISGHLFFHTRYGKGQRALFRVLHAFSLLCPDCGYCQGMGPIACTLLCYFEPAKAYAALVRLHDGARYNLHHVFSPGFPGLGVLFGLQSRLMAYLMPPLAKLLEDANVPPSMYATKWYITLFYNVVPFETQLRIWDAYLLDGRDVLVLTALALIWGCRARLFACAGDFEAIVETLTCFFAPEDTDAMMRWIRRVGRRKEVKRRMANWAVDAATSRF